MFSTLNKHDHSQRKKLFAEKYAMTNIVNSQIAEGVQHCAASVVRKCEASMGSFLDIYVCSTTTCTA